MNNSRRFPAWCSTTRVKKTLSAGEGLDALVRRMGKNGIDDNQMLRQLWMNWDMVMGDELAALAFPLGHRKDILLVGGEDNLVLQELSFQAEEILERANAFMGTPTFMKVELHLSLGRTPLTAIPDITPSTRPALPLKKPDGLTGTLRFAPDSPVGRFYEACLRRLGVNRADRKN